MKVEPNDRCSCGHDAALHGMDYSGQCTQLPVDSCPCGGFSLASKGGSLERDVRPAGPKVPQPAPVDIHLPENDGCWLAYEKYSPEGDLVDAKGVFATELEALRYAVENRLDVRYQEWGAI